MRVADLIQSFSFDLGWPLHSASLNVGVHASGFKNFDSLLALAIAPGSAGASPGDEFLPYFQESDPPVLTHQNTFDGDDDGYLALNDVVSGITLMGIPFTQDAVDDRIPSAFGVWLSRKGTPTRTGGNPSIHISILADSAGSPSGSALFDSFYISTDDIPVNGLALILFGTRGGVPVVNGGSYWIVIDGTYYDQSDANHIRVHYNTVTGTSGCKTYTGSWNAISNQDIWFHLYQLTFTDVPTDEIEGGAFNPYIEGTDYLNRIDSVQARILDLKKRKDNLRAKYAITGSGLYSMAFSAAAGYPRKSPVMGSDLQGGIIL